MSYLRFGAATIACGACPPFHQARLILRHREETTRHTLPFRHDTFRDFRWLGFYASDDIDGAFYLDDMNLSFDQ